MANFIKLNRKLLYSDTFSNPVTLKVWIWLLLKATWKERVTSTPNGRGYIDVKIKRGELIFGRKIVSEDLGISASALYRQIQKLKDMGNITIQPNTHYSIITICNYESYQSTNTDYEQPIGQPTIQATGQPIGQHTIQQTDTTKEGKEYKEGKEGEESKENIFDKKEIYNPPTFPTWRKEVSVFLKDERFKSEFCIAKKVTYLDLNKKMIDFVIDLNLREDYKNAPGIKRHFMNHHKKYFENVAADKNSGSMSNGFIEVPKDFDYESDNVVKW